MSAICKKTTVLLILIFLLFFSGASLSGQANLRGNDPLIVKVAVIGPGDELYFWWGHIGLVIENTRTGQSNFYDWGIFSFERENFFYNFAFGRLIYTCGAVPLEWNIGNYLDTNRDITLYTLDLPREKKEKILRYAEWSIQPENKDYYYHHFRDNCATRIRDIVDMALDGEFKEQYASMPGRFTLRQQVRRHTWFNPFFDWSLNFLMGQGIDTPITVWDDMFLPSEIGNRINEFAYTAAPGGKKTRLVSSVETLNTAVGRPQVLEFPRRQWPVELLASAVFSLAAGLAFLICGKRKGFRVFIGTVQSLLGLFFGIAGSILFFMTFFTDHDYTYYNSNILFVNPLFLAAVPLGLIFAFTGSEKKRFVSARILLILWVYTFMGGLLTMAIKLFPVFYQQNQVTQALVLPLAFTMILIMTASGYIRARQTPRQ
ncbi:MAG: DUF4105 domain-containing protein [Treponema sp.]|jgi:hypothetical protein|nr:DUF4105 domain-containing protein [Treponema sp.]